MTELTYRKNLIILLNLFLIWYLFCLQFLNDTDNEIPTERLRNADQGNEDSLLLFWENGTFVGIEIDLRIAVVIVAVLFFVSIFSTMMIFQHMRGDNFE